MAINIDGFYVTSVDMMTLFNNANELEAMLDELQDCTISNTQENNDITGKNGAVIGTLKRNKAVTITANSGLIVGGGIAVQTGSEVETGSFIVRKSEIVTVESDTATILELLSELLAQKLLLFVRKVWAVCSKEIMNRTQPLQQQESFHMPIKHLHFLLVTLKMDSKL